MVARRSRRAVGALLLGGLAVAGGLGVGCGGDGGEPSMQDLGPNPRTFFEPPPARATWTLAEQTDGSAPGARMTVEQLGTVEVDGVEFAVLTGTGTGPAGTRELGALISYEGNRGSIAELTVGGVPGVGTIEVSGPPQTVRLDPPVGVPQAVSVSDWELAINGTPTTVTIAGTYTLVGANETVETQHGAVSGCRHYRIEGGTTEIAGLPLPIEGEGEIWVRTGIGIVAGWYELPQFAGGARQTFSLESFSASGDAGGGRSVVRRDQLVSATSGTLDMSTYDVNEEFDADRNVHAKMLVEARWADPERARTDEMPPLSVEFTTIFGYFPHPGLVPMPASILNPHENGNGYRYWFAYVDQAARNEMGDGTSYGIEVRWFGDAGDSDTVRVSALINYRKLAE